MTTQRSTGRADTSAGDQRFAAMIPYRDDPELGEDYVHFFADSNVIVINGENARLLDHRAITWLSRCLDLKGTELPRFNQPWGTLAHAQDFRERTCIWTYSSNQLPESASSIDDFWPIEMPTSAILDLKTEFDAAKDEEFEDGMGSSFSAALDTAINKYGNSAVKTIADILLLPGIGSGVITETLRRLGNIGHKPSRQPRKEILLTYLKREELKFRDAAVLGLGGLDDPTVIPKLREVFEHEPHGLIRRKIQAVLAQLELTYR